MTNGLPIPQGGDITQYEHIQCTRPTDGSVLKAKRVMVDEQPPIRWKIELNMGGLDYRDRPLSPGAELEVWRMYTTDALLTTAKKSGYGNWYVLPEDFVESWPLELEDRDDASKKRLIPKYPLPDSVV